MSRLFTIVIYVIRDYELMDDNGRKAVGLQGKDEPASFWSFLFLFVFWFYTTRSCILIARCIVGWNNVCTEPGFIADIYTARECGNRFLLSGNQSAKIEKRIRDTKPLSVTN